MRNLGYIKRELIKLYGKKQTKTIIELGEKHYQECLLLCQGVSKGEYMHLDNTILPTVSFYKALLEIDSENALKNTTAILTGLCKKGGKALNIVLKLPGMKAAFMKLLSKMATRMFGRECGFDYTNFHADANCLQMDMTMCPYLKYAKLLNAPELSPLFCESDFATYGNLPGIAFKRTETLGTGGCKCDFKFLRTDK